MCVHVCVLASMHSEHARKDQARDHEHSEGEFPVCVEVCIEVCVEVCVGGG